MYTVDEWWLAWGLCSQRGCVGWQVGRQAGRHAGPVGNSSEEYEHATNPSTASPTVVNRGRGVLLPADCCCNSKAMQYRRACCSDKRTKPVPHLSKSVANPWGSSQQDRCCPWQLLPSVSTAATTAAHTGTRATAAAATSNWCWSLSLTTCNSRQCC